ncbi:related to multidrug resistance protein [Rhynchosporium secalis]|uniref:Related to multidrug resistance protein n=1 Tax=Rhynchosporium secalis TaxID=38038 RepID=A0A1E1LWH7_RHYSE|nr:related to multidrug resistance protein [Rhynchosporium secalis]
MNRSDVQAASPSPCQPSNDDTFGPILKDCRSGFDFTLLFEQTILSIGPASLLLLFAPPRIVTLLKSSAKTRFSSSRFLKSVVCLSLIGVQLGLLVLWSTNPVTQATLPASTLSFIAAIAVLLLSDLEDRRAVPPSLLLSIYLLASLIFDIAQVRTLYLRHETSTLLGLSTTSVVLKAVLLVLESRSKRGYLRVPYNGYSPETTGGIFNRSFFWWINPILATGFRRLLTLDDLFQTDASLLTDPLRNRMQNSWEKYQSRGTHRLTASIFHCLGWSFLSIIFPRLCLIGFNYSQPFLISAAIKYVSQPSAARDENDGYGLIGAAALIYLGIAISTTQYQHAVNRLLVGFRGATASLIYSKTLKQQAGVQDKEASLTHMSSDIDQLAFGLDALCQIWAQVIELVIGLYLLSRNLGWVCVAPIVIVVISTFCAGHVTKLIGPRQGAWIAAVQTRVGMTSTMLGSMKSVKMMGLSNILMDTLQIQRVMELNLSKKFRVMGMWRMIISFLPTTVGPMANFLIFAIKASVNGSERLSTSQTFSSLSIITLLTSPAEEFLQTLPMIGMATGCLARIEKYLLSKSCEDGRLIQERASTAVARDTEDGVELQHLDCSDGVVLSVRNASIKPSPSSPIAVRNIDIDVVKGSLTMIVGVVGSGKSTLLKAMIGELQCEKGAILANFKHSAYCSQVPWLQNTTFRNIVTAHERPIGEDSQWYTSVLHACALDRDVLDLPDQHDTIIGSRGVTLSGGQKQRLTLARAVYARRGIVVLDDVLSAIDGKTEALVINRLFGKRGLFKKLGSAVILATHAIKHLPIADNILILGTDGSMIEQGSYEDLRARKSQFLGSIIVEEQPHPSVNEEASNLNQNLKLAGQAFVRRKSATDAETSELTRRIGDASVYNYYLKSIGWKIAIVNVATALIWTLGSNFPPLWLTLYANRTVQEVGLFIGIYVAAVVIGLAAATGLLHNLYMKLIPKSGAGLHKILLTSVIGAPQTFFDETDSGLILNRFSQDMTLIDASLPGAAAMCFSAFLQCLAQFGLIATGSTYMALACPALVICVYFLQSYYLRTSRQMRFLDLEFKSPLYTHFSETIDGLSTIRAFGWEDYFLRENVKLLDKSQRPHYLMLCIQRWFNLVLLLLVGLTAVIVVALATSLTSTTTGGRLGVSLSSIVNFNFSLGMFMMFWTMMETSLGAIARLKTFEKETESEHKEEETFIPDENWPNSGAIEFRGVSASYGLSPALQDISFSIKSGEKIGICGRTNSGKSTLLSVLLRILNITSGTILVDGIDLSVVPRELIRSRIVTIPQEPYILSGSVRFNADPTSTTTDSSIIAALTNVGLWDILAARGGLDVDMAANPLSQGQQQIFCLARAMLKTNAKILVLDEATSNVDAETDLIMQRLIREGFKDFTVLTVAHRMDTISDSDRILVLDGGRLIDIKDSCNGARGPS